jgi:hypothetical protein
MCLPKSGIGLLVVVSAFIVAGCGELDTILSSNLSTNSVYRVNAVVEGRSLDECAIVGIDSRIRPYFIDTIEGDPDITGLVVFLETPEGELASRKVRYVPGSAEQSSEQAVGTDRSTAGQMGGNDLSGTPAEQTEDGETVSGEIESAVDAEDPDLESGESGRDEPLPVGDGSSPDGNFSREEEGAAAEQVSGLDDGWERGTVYQIRGKRSFSGNGEIADPDELVVYVPKLSGELPALLVPEKLAIGPYVLVFQVLGLQGVLSHSEKLIYYVSDAELALGDIQTYHPGNVERSGVVSPGSVLMLETKVSADARLEPYIVWYHGKNRIKEGPVSEGVDQLLWRTPAQTGFQAIKAEIFPFAPPAAYKNANGLVKELSLAISSKQARRAVGSTETLQPDSLIRLYQLGGDLSDSLAFQDGGRELVPGNDTIIAWLPKTGIYGLAAGFGRSYTIPGPLFTPDENLPGRGQFVFRFAIQSSGIIFSGVFTLDKTSQTLKLDLSCDTNTNRLTLSCALGDEIREQTLFLPFSGRDEWITVAVDFTTENKEFRTELSLLSVGNGELLAELASLSDKSVPAGKGIVLPGALTGKGVFRIGAAAVPANSSTSRASALAADTTEKTSVDGTAANFGTVKSGAGATVIRTAGDTSALLLTDEENRSAVVLTNITAAVTPVLADTQTAKASETVTPASALILDAIAILFRVDDSGVIDVVEAVDKTEAADGTEVAGGTEAADEAGAAKSVSEDGVPPKGVSTEQSGVQTRLSAGKNTPTPGTLRQPSISETGAENDTGRGSAEKESLQKPGLDDGGKTSGNPAGEEAASAISVEKTDLTQKTEDNDRTPDTHTVEILNLSTPKL